MEDKKKNILIAILIVGILTITVAFAALSSTLTIKSGGTIKGGSWEVLFVSGTGPSAPTSAPASGRSAYFNGTPSLSATIIQNINAVLTQPGDTLTYNFKIRNNGSIDAKLDIINSVTPTCTPSGDDATTVCNNITRSLKYVSAATKVSGGGAGTSTMTADSPVAVGDVLKAGEEISVDLTISYASGTTTTSFPATDVTVSYPDQVLTYIQDDGQGVSQGSGSGSGSGSNTPTYTFTSADSFERDENEEFVPVPFNNEWNVYLRNDGTNNEVCKVYPSGTTCLINSSDRSSDYATCSEESDDYYTSSDIDNSCITGYSKMKTVEMLSNGASWCYVTPAGVQCESPSAGGYCTIDADGFVGCYDSSDYGCNIQNDGRYNCD